MKWCSFWLFLMFAVWADAQAKEIAYLQNRNGLVYEVNHTKPFTGKQVEKWANEQKKSEVDFEDGKRVGFTTWYENGQKSSEVNFKGETPFHVTEWYENGQKKNCFFEKAIRVVKAQNAKNFSVMARGGQSILPKTIPEWIKIIDDRKKSTAPSGGPAYISGQGSSNTGAVGLQFNSTKNSLIITQPAFEENPRSIIVITFD